MAIKSISKIHDYGVFERFDRDAQGTADFSKRNLLYGWNYSGKTTFSRIFWSLEEAKPHADFKSGTFTVLLDDGTTLRSTDLEHNKVPVRVFNSDFVQNNLKWEEGVEPVFIIGEENISLQNELGRKRRALARLKNYQQKNRQRTEEINSELNAQATSAAERVRTTIGRIPFNRSPHLQSYVDALGAEASKYLLDEDAYRKQRSRLSAEQREEQSRLPRISDPDPLIKKIGAALIRTAQRDAIGRLESNSELEAWVDTGRRFHAHEKICQFCENPLPANLLERLAGHFSAAVSELRADLKALEAETSTAIESPNFFDKARLYSDLQESYETARSNCEALVAELTAQAEGLLQQIREKYSAPELAVELHDGLEHMLVEKVNFEIDSINSLIDEHNRRTRDFEAERKAAEEDLIQHETARYIIDSELRLNRDEIAGLRKRHDRAAAKIQETAADIEKIEDKLSDEVRGAKKINDYLALYFGNDEVKVLVKPDKKYYLSRSGRTATNLSEGERTAISFSYFLASLDSGGATVGDTVVYIDDPISSLDSNHLYNTFALIKSILHDCEQLFLSTHSFEFFRILKCDSFFEEFRSKVRKCSWYLIRRSETSGAEVVDLPVVLKKYNSEYHYIFSVLRRFNADPTNFPDILCSIPNLLRKMLEIYSSFKVPQTNMHLGQRLERLFPNEIERIRVYKFVNHLSHSDSMTLAVEFPQSEECRAVLSLVFEMLRVSDPKHYEGMCELVDESGA